MEFTCYCCIFFATKLSNAPTAYRCSTQTSLQRSQLPARFGCGRCCPSSWSHPLACRLSKLGLFERESAARRDGLSLPLLYGITDALKRNRQEGPSATNSCEGIEEDNVGRWIYSVSIEHLYAVHHLIGYVAADFPYCRTKCSLRQLMDFLT